MIISLVLGFAAVLVFIVSTIGGFVILGLAAFIYLGMPWNWYLQSELKKHKEKHQELSKQLDRTVTSYKSTQDLEQYNQHGKRIVQMIAQYAELPKNIQVKKRLEEERIYNQQLHSFLQQFRLQDHSIPGFGANRKQALYNAGITSASDISKLGSIKVQGIGPKYEQLLLSWQRQMASGFIYYPDNQQLNKAFLKILDDAAQSKKQLEQEIRSQYNGLQQLKQHILMKRKQIAIADHGHQPAGCAGACRAAIFQTTDQGYLTAIPGVEDFREILFGEIVGMDEEITNAHISPHDLLIGIDLEQQYKFFGIAIPIIPGITLSEAGISSQLMARMRKVIVCI